MGRSRTEAKSLVVVVVMVRKVEEVKRTVLLVVMGGCWQGKWVAHVT